MPVVSARPDDWTLRLGFLSYEMGRLLGRPESLTEADRQVLGQAEDFIGKALAGGERLAQQNFKSAASDEFGAFRWVAGAFAVTEGASKSEEVRKLVQELKTVLRACSMGEDVAADRVSRARLFFLALRSLVLARVARPISSPTIEIGGPTFIVSTGHPA